VEPTVVEPLALQRDDFEAWNELKVANIDRGHIETEMKRCSSDYKVLEADGDTLCSLFSLDTPGKLRNLQRDGMHDDIMKDFLGEYTPPFTGSFSSGPVNAMRSALRH
jgi:hypothetical protein